MGVREERPKALYLVRLWRSGSERLAVGGEVIDFDDYTVFAYYMLRHGKLVDTRGMRWCRDVYDAGCVTFSIPCPNLCDGVGGYIYGSVDYVVRARGAPGVLIPSKDEHMKLLEEGRIIDLTPEKHLSAFLAFRELRRRCLDMQDRLRKFLEEVVRSANI
ncbi:MAG: hypothetical protein DRO39_09055 [Thermoprotei archaeon]|nr:MAG: hypothetical protein DRO39_09055 [Thermoprotei archaeon]